MTLNDIYAEISSFWKSIYPIILFHFLFYFICLFVFGRFSVKAWLEKYIASPGFLRTKKILEQFELWTKLPFILLISALIYLALFDNVTDLVSSARLPLFGFQYSPIDFAEEYGVKENLIQIASYSEDTTGDLIYVYQLKSMYLEEYRSQFPEKYDEWVGWVDESFRDSLRYMHLSEVLLIALLITWFWWLKKRKEKRLRTTFRLFLVLLLAVPVLLVMRYRAEQKVEQTFTSEIIFVQNELTVDDSVSVVWTKEQTDRIREQWAEDYKIPQDYAGFWISRYVEKSPFLEKILGRRVLTIRRIEPKHR